MGRGFSEEEINELKEQFELFDMMGDGEYRSSVAHFDGRVVLESNINRC